MSSSTLVALIIVLVVIALVVYIIRKLLKPSAPPYVAPPFPGTGKTGSGTSDQTGPSKGGDSPENES